jgi:hypothetical protein
VAREEGQYKSHETPDGHPPPRNRRPALVVLVPTCTPTANPRRDAALLTYCPEGVFSEVSLAHP